MAGVTYKCPHCGAYLEFDPESGAWRCPFCQSGFTQADLQPPEASAAAQVAYHCPNCGREILTDDDGGDESDGHQYIGCNVKGSDKANDRFQDNGQAAENDCDPGGIKGERGMGQQARQESKAGNDEKCDVPAGAAPL